MQILAILLLALVVVLWVLRQAAHVPPAKLARMVKQGSGLLALGAAGLLLLRGRWDLGGALGGLGLWLVGMGAPVWWAVGKSLALLLGLAHMVAAQPGAVTLFPAMGGAAYALFLAGWCRWLWEHSALRCCARPTY